MSRIDTQAKTGRAKADILRGRISRYEPNLLQVKFKDEWQIRIRRGEPVDLRGDGLTNRAARRLLSQLKDCAWIRSHNISERRLDQFRKRGAIRRKTLPDLNNYVLLVLSSTHDLGEVLAAFDKLKEVEFATRVHRPVPPPTPPNFSDLTRVGPSQGYLGPSAINGGGNGIDAFFAWTQNGGDGANVAICDIEFDWNFRHSEFQQNGGLRIHGDQPLNPFGVLVSDHGTSVVGIYGSGADDTGTKGIAFNSNKFVCATVPTRLITWWNIAGAITTAMDALNHGDIILIEQHMPGPNSSEPLNLSVQDGYVPVEWDKANYDAIITAVANGFIVVEAAGNGGQDLDAPVYRSTDHRPFMKANDSGAIMVGAGHSGTRARQSFSNFGSRVNVQGWGNNVVTTASDPAQADLWSADGDNLLFKSNFSGTSSASPIVAGYCGCLQGIFRGRIGRSATPAEMRELLKQTRNLQGGDTTKHIGPLPDLREAVMFLDAAIPTFARVEPQSGSYPVPLEVHIATSFEASRGVDFETYYTLDGTEPTETGGARRLVDAFGDTIVLDSAGDIVVTAKTFCTDSFTGERMRGQATREAYRLYRPQAGPRKVKASRGSFVDKVVITWRTLRDAIFYDVFSGSSTLHNKLNVSPVIETIFEDTRTSFGYHTSYLVRATLASGRITRFSEPAVGWTRLPTLTVDASDATFADHILVSWNYPLWNPFSTHIEFKVFRAATRAFASAVEVALIRPKTRTVFVNNRAIELPNGIDTEYADYGVERGTNYYYWVTVYDRSLNIETAPGRPDNGYVA